MLLRSSALCAVGIADRLQKKVAASACDCNLLIFQSFDSMDVNIWKAKKRHFRETDEWRRKRSRIISKMRALSRINLLMVLSKMHVSCLPVVHLHLKDMPSLQGEINPCSSSQPRHGAERRSSLFSLKPFLRRRKTSRGYP